MRKFVTRRRLLFLILALLAARVAWVSWEAAFRNNVDAVSARFDQVLVGMDQKEVQRIMGKYKGTQTWSVNPDGSRRALADIWATAGRTLWVLYGADGTVVEKGANRAGFIDWLRRRLRFSLLF
jgi:hypothetical protein